MTIELITLPLMHARGVNIKQYCARPLVQLPKHINPLPTNIAVITPCMHKGKVIGSVIVVVVHTKSPDLDI